MESLDKTTMDLRKTLKARAFYNPELKLFSHGSSKKIFEYICKEVGLDNERLRKLNRETKPIIYFPTIGSFLMKTFGGYQIL